MTIMRLAEKARGMSDTSDRRQKIETLLQAEPGDPFLRYCLAMEMDKAGETDESFALFQALMRDPTPHVPAFFMAAQQQARLAHLDVAKALLRDGIEEARKQGDQHAAGEMSEFLQAL